MWPVSDRFLKSLGYGPRFVNLCTVTPPSGDPISCTVIGGNLRVDSTQRVRRRIESFEILGDSTVYEQVTTPGALFEIEGGVSYRSSDESIPIFTGEALAPRQRFGGGTISLTLVDHANMLSRCRFVAPYIVAAGTTRVAAITTVVQFIKPGTIVIDESGDTSTIATQMMWTENALDVIDNLTTDASLEGFFRPDGAFVIRQVPTVLTPAAWSIIPGRGGTLTSLDRIRPTDRLFNTVVAQPSALDGSQTWTDQIAAITDPTDPLYPSNVGVGTVPLFLPLPTAATAAAALSAAHTRLDKVRGRTESLLFGTISNPALEGGDVVRIGSPQVGNDLARTWQHYVDSFDYDLNTGLMSGQTRAQVIA